MLVYRAYRESAFEEKMCFEPMLESLLHMRFAQLRMPRCWHCPLATLETLVAGR
jgi:hypothetical protein